MSLEKIHLRKLLQIFYAADNQRQNLLRGDIRNEIKKKLGENTGGGDFHSPFWADAKKHVRGELDLRSEVKSRIETNKSRERLYPLLATGFLSWWDERRRWKNEDFEFLPENIHAQFVIAELNVTVKIESLLALIVGDQSNRIIYPYFSEKPRLTEEGARLGLWCLGQAFKNYKQEDFRMLDILRSASFSTLDIPLRGDERDLFLRKYENALKEREKLLKQY